MTFEWSFMGWALLVLPLLIVAYIWLRRRKVAGLRFGHFAVVRDAHRRFGRQHVPPALAFVAVALLLTATMRPQSTLTLPQYQETVILAIDVSGSMRAKDVEPDRMTVAKSAARAFVQTQPRSTRTGLVVYSDSAMLVQPPTSDRQLVIDAIERMEPQWATAIGDAIYVALEALGFDKPEIRTEHPVPPGSYKHGAIILLTDGESNRGSSPVLAAQAAADRGVRVYTVALGTPHGTIPTRTGGGTMIVKPDPETMAKVAQITGGEFFSADDGLTLHAVYEGLVGKLTLEPVRIEITALLSAAAALVMVLAATLSLLWFPRVMI